jgi:TonB family protein
MKAIKLSVTFAGVLLLGCIAAANVRSAEPPLIVTAVAPIYPPIARDARVTGEVFVDVEIDREGKVTSAKAVNAHKLLEQAVVEAARRWRFLPELKYRSARMARLTFSFVMLPEKAPVLEATSVFYPQDYKIEVRSIEHVLTTPSN